MRDAARALDDVSDHLGEVLRHADQLLDEWSRFGAQVRAQVEREAGAIGTVVDDAVTRAASAGVDKAIAERLSALTAEIGRLETRTKAAARAVADQRENDRRIMWIIAAGVVLTNVLLVALWLRKPDAPPPPEPVQVQPAPAPVVAPPPQPAPTPTPAQVEPAAGSAAGSGSAAAAELPKDPKVAPKASPIVIQPPKHGAPSPHKKSP